MFSTPLMKYCFFVVPPKTILAPCLVRCNCHSVRSRARGVEQLEMVIPCCMGSVFLFDPRARWECLFCIFQHFCGGYAPQFAFLKLPNGLVTFRLISRFEWCPHMMYFWSCCKNGVPTVRGDHIFELVFP